MGMTIVERVKRARELCGCTACVVRHHVDGHHVDGIQPQPCQMSAAIYASLASLADVAEERRAALGVCENHQDHGRIGPHSINDRCQNWQFTHTVLI
jgi:hypothetical protein